MAEAPNQTVKEAEDEAQVKGEILWEMLLLLRVSHVDQIDQLFSGIWTRWTMSEQPIGKIPSTQPRYP